MGELFRSLSAFVGSSGDLGSAALGLVWSEDWDLG